MFFDIVDFSVVLFRLLWFIALQGFRGRKRTITRNCDPSAVHVWSVLTTAQQRAALIQDKASQLHSAGQSRFSIKWLLRLEAGSAGQEWFRGTRQK